MAKTARKATKKTIAAKESYPRKAVTSNPKAKTFYSGTKVVKATGRFATPKKRSSQVSGRVLLNSRKKLSARTENVQRLREFAEVFAPYLP